MRPTASLESGIYRNSAGWSAPLVLRIAFDDPAFGVSAAGGRLLGTGTGVPNGWTVGAGAGVNLWSPGRTGYLAVGGRLQAAAEYARFGSGADAVKQIDLPVAFALVHELSPLQYTASPWVAVRVGPRIIDAGGVRTTRAVAGLSAGFEFFKARCATGKEHCLYGWGIRLGFDAARDVARGPLEGGVTFGVLWKFF